MSDRQRSRIRQVTGLIERHRNRLLAAVAVVMVYALLGFLVAPWLVKKSAVESVRENLDAELRIAEVAINPFVLSLRVDGLELDDPSGDAFARVEEIFVNFQLSSLFRWAWTFDEIRIASPEFDVARDSAGMLNVARFEMPDTPEAPAESYGEEEGMFAEQQREVLEALFTERAEAGDPELALEELRAGHTTLTEAAEDEEPQEQFDALVYTNDLRRRLIELQPLADTELDALALERRNNTQAAIVAIDPELQSRIRLVEPQDVGAEDDGIHMKVAVTASAEE